MLLFNFSTEFVIFVLQMAKKDHKEMPRNIHENLHTISNHIDRYFRGFAIYTLEHRGIPSFYDALTNVQRYVLQNAPRSFNKTISLVGKCISDGYHHGDGSLSGAINKVAKPFGASEPFLIGDGFFGSPVNPEAAAPRYTSVKLNPIVAEILDQHKDLNLKNDDEQWEYLRMEVPVGILSTIMGIGVGYKSSVLPRKLSEIKKFLDGDENADLRPHFGKFSGKISPYNGLKKTWLMEGVIETDDSQRTVRILEIPPLIKYEKFIKKLSNFTENSKAEFHLQNDSRDTIDITLRHRGGVPWEEFKERIEKMTKILVSEILIFTKDKTVVEYDEMPDYLREFKVHREHVRYCQSEYDHRVYSEELEFLKAKLLYLKFMLEKKRSESEVDTWLNQHSPRTRERLNRILLRDLTAETIKKTEDAIVAMTKQLAEETVEMARLKESYEEMLKSLPKRKSTVKTRQVDEEEERDGIEIYNFLNEDEEDESENIGEDEEYL